MAAAASATATTARGVWHVRTPSADDRLCVSNLTPLSAFASCVRVDEFQQTVSEYTRDAFTCALVCDGHTWALLNELATKEGMGGLVKHMSPGGQVPPLLVLGRLTVVEHIGNNTRSRGGIDTSPRQRASSPPSPPRDAGADVAPPAQESEGTAGPSPSPILLAGACPPPALEESPRPVPPADGVIPGPLRSDTVTGPDPGDPPASPEGNQSTALGSSASAKAQEHCRIAMGALDCADAERARAEIRAAIALLGGDF